MKHSFSNMLVLSILTMLLITSCATRLDTISPKDTDLSGTWALDRNLSQTVSLGGAGQQNSALGGGMGGGMSGGGQDSGEGSRSQAGDNQASQGGRGFGGSRLTSAMRAIEMTIEQNHDSMGIAYPDELYRDVDWGEKEFFRETVTAGWQDNSLIVKSAGDEMTITETYQINASQDILTLTISIKDPRGSNEFVRVFNRQE